MAFSAIACVALGTSLAGAEYSFSFIMLHDAWPTSHWDCPDPWDSPLLLRGLATPSLVLLPSALGQVA